MATLPILLLDVSHDFTVWEEELSKWTQVPVGLSFLAAALRQRYPQETVSVRVMDVAMQPGYFAKVQEVLRDFRPRIVGLRALSLTGRQLHAAARVVKEWSRGALVVAGGPYASSSPELIMEDPLIDAVCPGEGEQVIVDLAERLLTGATDLTGIPGLTCRHEGQVHRAAPAPLIADLDRLPFPDYEGLDLSAYWGKHPHTAVGRPYASLVCSRGCPYGCIFCHTTYGRTLRHRSPEHIARECQELHARYGIRDFVVADDGFNVNLDWAKRVLRAIAALKLSPRIFFSNGLRGDIWDDEFLDLMVEAGVAEVFYAVESAAPRIQQILRKRLDIPRVEQAIVATSRRGIITNGFFMVGIPGETKEEVELTVAFITRQLEHLDFAYMSVMRAYQDSPAQAIARSLGYDEHFLREHALMPYCMQVRVGSEYNFIPYELLKWARMQMALRVYQVPRMKRVLARLRRVLDEDEIVMKLATYMSTTRIAAQDVLRRYDQGVLDGVPPAAAAG
ncbi:MAG TPA: radical SAM protein [Polyangia bacterium]